MRPLILVILIARDPPIGVCDKRFRRMASTVLTTRASLGGNTPKVTSPSRLSLLGRIGLLGEAGRKRPLFEKKSGADEN